MQPDTRQKARSNEGDHTHTHTADIHTHTHTQQIYNANSVSSALRWRFFAASGMVACRRTIIATITIGLCSRSTQQRTSSSHLSYEHILPADISCMCVCVCVCVYVCVYHAAIIFDSFSRVVHPRHVHSHVPRAAHIMRTVHLPSSRPTVTPHSPTTRFLRPAVPMVVYVCVCVRVCARACACVCVCVCKQARVHARMHASIKVRSQCILRESARARERERDPNSEE